ncbi:MAG: hypothetical protein L0Y56_12900 [Nitrospira sp.]|nr:hypothetical protein [Nitrospira sp.]
MSQEEIKEKNHRENREEIQMEDLTEQDPEQKEGVKSWAIFIHQLL